MDIERYVEQTFAKKVRITVQNEVQCIISGLHPDHAEYFVDEYAMYEEGYFFRPKYKLGVWDGKKRFFTPTGNTYVYMLDDIIPKITSLGYKIELNDKRTSLVVDVEPIDEDYFSHVDDPLTGKPWKIRPYQLESLNELFKFGFGVVIAGTGAGKTSINAALVERYAEQGLRSITIVPSTSLVSQTIKAFRNFGLDTGEYSGEAKDIDHTHVVSTWQALQNNPKLISQFNVLVVDECHGAKAKVIGELINNHGKNIAYRFGLTGTLPKAKADAQMIFASLGPVRFEIPAHELIAEGWLSVPNITILQLDDQTRLNLLMAENNKLNPDEKFTYDSEISFLQQDKPRLEWIAEFIVEKGSAHKGNVLCLVSNVQYGKKLSRLIPQATFLYGKDKQKVRQQVYDLFESHNDLIVIATVQIAGVGLSIDRIFNLIYIDGGKSFVRTIQTIGRGLRKGKDKDSVDVVDICGNLDYSKEHLRKRVKYYKEAKYKHKKLVVNYSDTVDF